MADSVSSDNSDRDRTPTPVVRKNPRRLGRPRKKPKLDNTSLANVERLFDVIEKKLTASLSNLVADAMAPLRSMVHDQIQAINSRLLVLEDNFNSQLKQLKAEIIQLQQSSDASMNASPTYAEATKKSSVTDPVPPPDPRPQVHRTDRSLNLVIFGIKESKRGTHRHTRSIEDLASVTATLAELDTNLDDFSIRVCYRLGKFSDQARFPRPILVKFNRAMDVARILSNRSKLRSPVVIKPDLTPEQRSQEAALLKQRWRLIQSGTPKKSIKIRGNKLLLNNRVHGQVVNSEYCVSPLLSDVATGLKDLPNTQSADNLKTTSD